MLSRLVYLVLVVVAGILLIALFRVPQLGIVRNAAFEVLGPIETLVDGPTSGLAGVTRSIQDIRQLRAENARLRAQVDTLTQEAVQVTELQRENAQLRAQLQLKQQQPELQWISAQIIGYDPSNLVQSITIADGSHDGVVVGMTVITPVGLVGQVVQVTPVTSKILLASDISSSVDAIVLSNRAHGVVYGTRGNELVMKYIPQGVTVKTGDRVVTSGLGGVFPQGILIGTVSGVKQNDVDLYQEAQIDPAVDFSRIESVLVVTNHLPVPLP